MGNFLVQTQTKSVNATELLENNVNHENYNISKFKPSQQALGLTFSKNKTVGRACHTNRKIKKSVNPKEEVSLEMVNCVEM